MRVRIALWAAGVSLPLIGLWVLLAQPSLDVTWEQHPAHFWIVLAAAVASMVLALATGDAARQRNDPRVYLVSLAFLTSAGFLALHALATPGVIVAGKNAGFVIATPVGLAVASFFVAASSLLGSATASAEWVMRRRRLLWWGVLAVMSAWAAVSLSGIGPLDRPVTPESTSKPFIVTAGVGCILYGSAAYRYFGLYRRERPLLVLGVVTAFVLLAEAMLAVAFGRNWHATWWEWHVLMAAAFLLIFASARIEYARTGSVADAFSALYLDRLAPRLAAAEQELRKGATANEVRERHRLSAEELAQLERSLGWTRELARPDEGLAEGDRDVSVLFADLQGFTAFSERMPAHEVLRMLNENFEAVVPVLRREGARIDKFVGDAVMAEFGLGGEPDHAERAARAALALQDAAGHVASRHEGWPRFRVGVNTGPVRVGTIGGHDLTVVGDTVNLASRLESRAEAGQVVIGEETFRRLPAGAHARRLDALSVKGKTAPVDAYVLDGLPADRDERGDRLDHQEHESER